MYFVINNIWLYDILKPQHYDRCVMESSIGYGNAAYLLYREIQQEMLWGDMSNLTYEQEWWLILTKIILNLLIRISQHV